MGMYIYNVRVCMNAYINSYTHVYVRVYDDTSYSKIVELKTYFTLEELRGHKVGRHASE